METKLMREKPDMDPLFEEMPLEKEKVYTFFSKPVVGRTKLMTDLADLLISESDMKGVFFTTENNESLAKVSFMFGNFNMYKPDKINWIVDDSKYDYDKLIGVLDETKPDFLIVDNVIPDCREKTGNPVLVHLREIAQKYNLILLCTAQQSVRFYMEMPPVELLEQSAESAAAKALIEQSDYVTYMSCWSYYHVSYKNFYDDSMDFYISKTPKQPIAVKIEHFREFNHPELGFMPTFDDLLKYYFD